MHSQPSRQPRSPLGQGGHSPPDRRTS
jgi:hypothetical protein